MPFVHYCILPSRTSRILHLIGELLRHQKLDRKAGCQRVMQMILVKPKVDEGLCIGCGICAGVCPSGAIEVKEKAEIDLMRCVVCGNCVRACPQNAIKLTPISAVKPRAARRTPAIRESNKGRLLTLGNRVETLSSHLDEIKEEIKKLKEMERI